MMDCCKPSAGFVANNLNFDQNYPAVLSCKADGFTRMDGSFNPFASTTPGATRTPAVTTPAPTTTPVVTTTTVSDTCVVKFFEGNGANKGEWTYTATAEGAGKVVAKDWRKSSKNDELTSLCSRNQAARSSCTKIRSGRAFLKFLLVVIIIKAVAHSIARMISIQGKVPPWEKPAASMTR